MPKKLYDTALDGKRSRGRPKGRWRDGVLQDILQLELRKVHVMDREKWKAEIEKPKGCYMRLLS